MTLRYARDDNTIQEKVAGEVGSPNMQRQYTLSDMKIIIQTRARYFNEMKKYIEGLIASKDVDEDEVEQFIGDVLGLTVNYASIVKEDLLNIFVVNITNKFNEYINLIKCLAIKNADIGVVALSIILEQLYLGSEYEKKSFREFARNNKQRVSSALNECDYLKGMHESLSSLMPDEFKDIYMFIKPRPVVNEKAQSAVVNICVDKRVVHNKLRKNLGELEKEMRNSSTSVMRALTLTSEKKQHMDDVLKEMEAAVRRLDEANWVDKYGSVLICVEAYAAFLRFFESIVWFRNEVRDANAKERLSHQVLTLRDDVQARLTGMRDDVHGCLQSLLTRRSGLSSDCLEEEKSITEVKERLDLFIRSCEGSLSQEPVTEPLVKQVVSEMRLEKKEIKEKIASIDVLLSKKEKEQEEALALRQREKEALEAARQQQAADSARVQSAAFFEDRAKRAVARVEQLQKEKEEKEAAKKSALKAPAPVATTNVALSAKTANLLLSLDANKLELIARIHHRDKGVKYNNVERLIEYLGGTVEEIGNGGSHKRIRFGDILMEFYSSESSPKVSSVVGTIVKPHSESHHSGKLCKFTLGLLSNLLSKAQITLENIAYLESVREQDESLISSPICTSTRYLF